MIITNFAALMAGLMIYYPNFYSHGTPQYRTTSWGGHETIETNYIYTESHSTIIYSSTTNDVTQEGISIDYFSLYSVGNVTYQIDLCSVQYTFNQIDTNTWTIDVNFSYDNDWADVFNFYPVLHCNLSIYTAYEFENNLTPSGGRYIDDCYMTQFMGSNQSSVNAQTWSANYPLDPGYDWVYVAKTG